MNSRKKLMLASIASVAILAGGAATQQAMAADNTTSGATLVEKIATTFNLNKDDVQKVFDDNRTEKDAAREAKEEDKLTAAVTAGTLTQAQKDLIVSKRAELKTKMEAERAAHKAGTEPTAEEKEAHKADRDALKQWATDNKIDMKWLMPGGPGRGGHGGPGMNKSGEEAPVN